MATSKEEREEQAQIKKEEARLQREPFKTTVEPSAPEVVDELRGWIPPGRAYVLMEVRKYNLATREFYRGLGIIDVEGRPEKKHTVQYFIDEKQGRVLHYGNFPTLDHPSQARAARVMHYGGPNKINYWAELAKFCDGLMNKASVFDEVNQLRRKVAEQEALLEAKNGKKDNTTSPVANQGASTKSKSVSSTGGSETAGA
jgi:hypothetical protein